MSVTAVMVECVDAVPGTATTSICIDLMLRSWCLQSTSLPKEVAEQLDDMFEHKPLGAAADTIKHQHKKLRKWQAKFGQNEPNQQMDSAQARCSASSAAIAALPCPFALLPAAPSLACAWQAEGVPLNTAHETAGKVTLLIKVIWLQAR